MGIMIAPSVYRNIYNGNERYLNSSIAVQELRNAKYDIIRELQNVLRNPNLDFKRNPEEEFQQLVLLVDNIIDKHISNLV
ncbi:MAG: hypothetical protein J6W16_04985 [Methanobrevibacter sp.]|nr:hypothetical protein [Methanobrevibacter sp.]